MNAGSYPSSMNAGTITGASKQWIESIASQPAMDLLLDALATLVTEGRAAAAPLLRRATAMFADEASPGQENFRWGWLTTISAKLIWDEDGWHAVSARFLREGREAGALARLPIAVVPQASDAAPAGVSVGGGRGGWQRVVEGGWVVRRSTVPPPEGLSIPIRRFTPTGRRSE